MLSPHDHLLELLDAHWVLHVAWTDPQRQVAAHCTPLYYARLQSSKECALAGPLLVFASDPNTEHGKRFREGALVGASIALECEDFSQIRGASLRLQIHRAAPLGQAWVARARGDYLTRHPLAEPVLRSGKAEFYLCAIRWAKLTDNRRCPAQHPQIEYPPPF